MRSFAILLVPLLFLSLTLSFPLRIPLAARGRVLPPRLASRQVGEGVTGNHTGNNGSVRGGGIGDGNGVGFAGTGNDIDTGDDFDIGDGNNTIGDNNSIEIGDRITTINLPLNMSEIVERGIATARTEGVDVSVDIQVRMRVGDVQRNGTAMVGGK